MLRKMFLMVMLLVVILVYATTASAARTILAPITAPTSYATSGVLLEWNAADTVNYNRFLNTGREVLLVDNTGADTYTVTVHSVADPYGRTGNTTKSVAAGTKAVFQMFPTAGWQQSDGYIYVDTTSASVKFAVIRLP